MQIGSLPQTAGRRPDSRSLLDVTMERALAISLLPLVAFTAAVLRAGSKNRRQPLWMHRREKSLTCTACPQPSEVRAFVSQLQPTGEFVKLSSP